MVQIVTQPRNVEIKTSGLVTADTQNAPLKKGGYPDLAGPLPNNSGSLIKKCKLLIEAVRGRGIKIVHLRMTPIPLCHI